MSHTFLIASGAYVEAEMQVEFGRLPPAFLPLGHQRLFVHQRAALGPAGARVMLTLPEGFAPDAVDARALAELGIEVVLVPEGLSLGQSVVYAINVTAAGAPLALLHGDTLLRGLDLGALDAFAVEAAPPPGYGWGQVRTAAGRLAALTAETPPGDAVLSGYFAFADSARLVQGITRCGGSFLAGLADYAAARPVRPLAAERWLDFGHAGTYHRSRRAVTTEREFNRLTADRRAVVKSGSQPAKLAAEAQWFEQLPPALRLHAPAYLGRRGTGAYALEYLHLPTLADLFVFGRLQRPAWDRIFAACDEFLSACAEHPAPPGTAAASAGLYLDKTLARLEQHARATGLALAAPCRSGGAALPSLERIARLAAAAIPPAPAAALGLVHGDFCFSNILYDARADLVRVIDPRGLDAAGQPSAHGDRRYDIAKLHHSAVGRYDTILAGACRLRQDGPLDLTLELPESPATRAATEAFAARRFAGMGVAEAAALPISVLLFLAMLPLHADSAARQAALLANALRLFRLMDPPLMAPPA